MSICTSGGCAMKSEQSWPDSGGASSCSPRLIPKTTVAADIFTSIAPVPTRAASAAPGTHRRTHSGSGKIKRRSDVRLLFLRGLEQYCVGKVKMRSYVCVSVSFRSIQSPVSPRPSTVSKRLTLTFRPRATGVLIRLECGSRT